MPLADLNGVAINYEIIGKTGPWVALTPGGRRPLESLQPMAENFARSGYRVLLHDRRNCGASDVVIDGTLSEYEIWADDLHELLRRFGGFPAVIGGFSAGCRVSIVFALRYPQALSALLLWRVTGGPYAAEFLADLYYGQFIRAAAAGGMAAVCESEFFAERIAARPQNRERLMAMDPDRFIAVMSHWAEAFTRGADLPVIGASAEQLRTIKVPTCIIPGDDKVHPREIGRNLHKIIASSELQDLMPEDFDLPVGPIEEWYDRYDQMAGIFTDLLKRTGVAGRV